VRLIDAMDIRAENQRRADQWYKEHPSSGPG
jgi:hypothetical protein